MAGNVETERKFLVPRAEAVEADRTVNRQRIAQGYLTGSSGPAVRIRISGSLPGGSTVATITVKGPRTGMSRTEHESEVDPVIAQALLRLCGDRVVHKTRCDIHASGREWSVDEFGGHNDGLVIAETELTAPDTVIEVPAWCGREVTDDDRFYNESLASRPQPATRSP